MYKKVALILLGLTICFHPIASADTKKVVNNKPANTVVNAKIIARYGMKGDDVKTVQEKLIKAGFL
ncbi:hypothetical protein SCACP_21090 [Sporomusa carbonis]|uniref:hypothetical protein n=1 Tax=Sporomusa carbonis TaxID=3076075 RepID=UPI003A73770A